MIRRSIPLRFASLLLLTGAACTSLHAQVVPPEQVVPLTLSEGAADDPGRVFEVPVLCDDLEAQFEFGASGATRISQSMARRCIGQIEPDPALDRTRAPDGEPVFLGRLTIDLRFGGRDFTLRAMVMKDKYCQKPEKQGMLGYDALRPFQWEVDPTVPSLTLRPPGAPPEPHPLSVLPMGEDSESCFVRVRIRNVTEKLDLMPGSSFVQAGVPLQRAWDFSSGRQLHIEVNRFGSVREIWLHGDDVVELGPHLRETDLPVALIGDPRHPDSPGTIDSGLGQCVLNRFVYCVDAKRHQLRLLRRVANGAERSAASTSRP